jgi:MFS family permease
VALLKMESRVPPRRDELAPKATAVRLLSWYPWRFAALALLIGSTTYLPVVYAPFLMREMEVTSPTLIGLVLTGDSILGALFALAFGRSRRWFNSPQTFVFSFAFTGAGAFIAGLAPSLPLVIVGLLVFGIGMGWLVPNLVTSLATCVSADRQAPAAGLTKAFHYVASPACILVIEPLAAIYGPQSAMWAVVLISAVMLVLYGSRAWSGSDAMSLERESS